MKRTLIGLTLTALFAMPAANAAAALNAYLLIKGTSTKSFAPENPSGIFRSLCTNEVIEAVTTRSIQSPRDPASGQATGKRTHKPLRLTKIYDKASPLLAKAFQTQEKLPEITMHLYRNLPGGQVEIYAKVTMADCYISNYQIGGGSGSPDQALAAAEGSRPMESLSINFTKIEYRQVTGKQGAQQFKWDIKTSNKI